MRYSNNNIDTHLLCKEFNLLCFSLDATICLPLKTPTKAILTCTRSNDSLTELCRVECEKMAHFTSGVDTSYSFTCGPRTKYHWRIDKVIAGATSGSALGCSGMI